MALAILSGLPPQELIRALLTSDLAALTAISGVGKKTAERLVMELKDKFADEALSVGARAGMLRVHTGELADPLRKDALAALLSLGYADPLARRALQEIGATPDDTVQSLIRKSLGVLSR